MRPGIASRVLVADDQADVRDALRLLLKGEGIAAEMASAPAEVLAANARKYTQMGDL